LAKKHFFNVPRSKEAEHETIVYCKAHPDVKIIKAIGLVIDEMRANAALNYRNNEATLLMAPLWGWLWDIEAQTPKVALRRRPE
jgi:hypothetical protein